MIKNIPNGWRVEELGNCVDILDNQRIPLNNQDRENRIKNKNISSLYPYYGATKQVGYIDDYIFDEELVLLGEDGVMFYDKDKPKAYIIRGKTWVNNHAHVLRAKNGIVINKYILNYLNIFNYKGYVSGSTRLKLNQSRMAKIPIPLPPLPQQGKIVKVLDLSSILIEKQKKLIEKYDLFLKSKFIEMFGDPISNPMGWEVVSCIDVANCIVPGRDKPKSFTGDIPWITTNDLKLEGEVYCSKSKMGLSDNEIANVRAKIIPKESVIFTCVGDLGVVSITKENVIMNQQLHSFQCKERINNYFLMFNISQQKPYMYKMATSTTVPYMNKTICNNIPTILPPIKLQNKFSSIVKQIGTIKEKETKKLEHLETLHNSIIDKAFKGEIK